jgi:hypothetical protein
MRAGDYQSSEKVQCQIGTERCPESSQTPDYTIQRYMYDQAALYAQVWNPLKP